MSAPALVVAAHGTRVAEGVAACEQLVQRVRERLGGVEVRAGYVELVDPPIHQAVAELLERHDELVVVPLMVGTGAHVQHDIPEEVAQGRRANPSARVVQTNHLGPRPELVAALARRIGEACDGWEPGGTTVVLVGRGSLAREANADHVRLARQLQEEHGYAEVLPGFIQVTGPDVTASLERARLLGAQRVVVCPNFLFPGRLEGWLADQVAAWQRRNPQVPVRVADVLGPCEELADVVCALYRQGRGALHAAAASAAGGEGSPVYLAGLALAGRRVLVAGAGRVVARRLERLLEAGAEVTVVAPQAHPEVQRLAEEGRLQWLRRDAGPADLAGAWYVMAATDDPDANARLAEAAEQQRTFCVRADDAWQGTAWTATCAQLGEFTVGVVGNRDPHGSRRLRDRIVAALGEADAEPQAPSEESHDAV